MYTLYTKQNFYIFFNYWSEICLMQELNMELELSQMYWRLYFNFKNWTSNKKTLKTQKKIFYLFKLLIIS